LSDQFWVRRQRWRTTRNHSDDDCLNNMELADVEEW
jgi:hypothetical protein